MHTYTQPAVRNPAQQDYISPRLAWLLAANQRAAEQAKLFRTPREELETQLLQQPLTAQQAFGRFGALLGTLPPAALFGRFLYHIAYTGSEESFGLLLGMALLMTLTFAAVGWRIGQRAGEYALTLRDTNWFTALPAYALMGFYWAVITGAAGGLVFLGIGALAGPLFALPVGVLAFILFAPLHRLLERGGLIEARHFWPLACGIAMSLAAFILGLEP